VIFSSEGLDEGDGTHGLLCGGHHIRLSLVLRGRDPRHSWANPPHKERQGYGRAKGQDRHDGKELPHDQKHCHQGRDGDQRRHENIHDKLADKNGVRHDAANQIACFLPIMEKYGTSLQLLEQIAA
jgi:hypothetical protein